MLLRDPWEEHGKRSPVGLVVALIRAEVNTDLSCLSACLFVS